MQHTPTSPRHGLLGGASKPSKLAALAAARRKKEDQKQQSEQQGSAGTERAINLLNRLGPGKDEDSRAMKQSRFATAAPTPSSALSLPVRNKNSAIPKPEPEPETRRTSEPAKSDGMAEVARLQDLSANPSSFALALIGSLHGQNQGVRNSTRREDRSTADFFLPSLPQGTSDWHDPFSGPSPDDVVLTAQSKGSLLQ